MEAALYSDADITGHRIKFGAYSVFNTLDKGSVRFPPMSMVVRLSVSPETYYRPAEDGPNVTDLNEKGFNGGDLLDEVAALLGLALGIRCQSGGTTRRWWPEVDDALGTPFEYDHIVPYLQKASRFGPALPRVQGEASLDDALVPLSNVANLDPLDATALVRAARLYQQALWIADSDPNLAWILLVSSLEAGAERWRSTSKAEVPSNDLAADWPEIYDAVKNCDAESLNKISVLLGKFTGAAGKFLSFALRFIPPPPASRPPIYDQVDWSMMRKHLTTIYRYRSRALHGGTPFPPPMLRAPRMFADGVPTERPPGLASGSGINSWPIKTTPMLLATFEYIAGGVLRNWWHTISGPV